MIRIPVRLGSLLLVLALLAAACGDDDGSDAEPGESTTTTTTTTSAPTTTTTVAPTTTVAVEPLRINDLQLLGSHNSYHLRPEPQAYGAIAALSPELAESIDYSHRSLTEQLEDFGVRQFEIDVFADPDGGLYASRAALPLVGLPAESGLAELEEPGFKVLHTQDFDFETNCLTLQLCLGEVAAWSDANPDHLPVMIMIEIKEQSVPDAAAGSGLDISDLPVDWTIPVPTDAGVLAALDAELVEAHRLDRIIRPDDVRGERPTLEEAVLADEWPSIDDSRGKVLFAMVNTGASRDVYRDGAPSLEGRVMFTTSTPGDPDGAFLRIDDPISGAEEIARRAAEGYLIRTRTDSPTADARTGDTTRRDAAVGSGAHFLSTDYYVEDPAFGTGYSVPLPSTCNPVTAPPACELDLAA